jgi:hypothetical protein
MLKKMKIKRRNTDSTAYSAMNMSTVTTSGSLCQDKEISGNWE